MFPSDVKRRKRADWNRHLKRGWIIFLAMAFSNLFGSEMPEPFIINDDGGWCWFQDERVLVHENQLWVTSVATGRFEEDRKGNIEVATFDLSSEENQRFVLHENLQSNDHATPALLALPDDRVLTFYSGHNHPEMFFRKTVRPADVSDWTDAKPFRAGEKARVTYANLIRLSEENGGKGRIYNFFRGFDPSWKPSWMTSDDGGENWISNGLWIDMPSEKRHRPYVKYVGNGKDEIHFVFTEGHPQVIDNSIYHAFYRDGNFYRSDGKLIHSVEENPMTPALATRVFTGSERKIAWTNDLHLDEKGNPVTVFSVQHSEGRLPPRDPNWGQDLRYHYARWDGEKWNEREIAFAGTRLYPGEDDYSGLIALDPQDLSIVYLSANVDPESGEKLKNGHYQIFQGKTEDGLDWRWRQLTDDEDRDNLRPVVPIWENEEKVAVVWTRGEYRKYTDYDLEMVGLILER